MRTIFCSFSHFSVEFIDNQLSLVEVTTSFSVFNHWITLKDQSSIPENLRTNARFIKQRSEEWFELQEIFKVTGSSLYGALGLDLLKNQQAHFVVSKLSSFLL
jgi:hypothetical protein